MNIHFIKTPEKRRIIEELNKQFGIETLPYLLIQTGKEKIRGFSGNLSKEEIIQLSRLTNIEIIGLYMLKKEGDFRITLDAIHLIKGQIKNNIIEINDEQLQDWLRGRDLNIQTNNRNKFIIKHNDDFIGFGKSNGIKIFNYIPKDRRLKK